MTKKCGNMQSELVCFVILDGGRRVEKISLQILNINIRSFVQNFLLWLILYRMLHKSKTLWSKKDFLVIDSFTCTRNA